MNNIKLYGLTGICLVLTFLLMLKSCELNKAKLEAELNRVPDTIYVPKPYKVIEIKKEYIEKPVKVFVYLKDTALRKEAERSDIITGIDFKRGNLFHKMDFIKVDKISPAGLITSNEYKMPEVREIKIDLKGNVEVKKKRHIATPLKIIGSAVLFGTAGYFIHQEIHK